ncbi:MAG: sigma-54 dependent transcriptional regulator [Polyangiaceae bacterium]|nr:sigma-54 dependent transcriptional regulator [Polyangiaceae bacterium]
MGETGVGTELLARAVHANSARSHAPLLTLNCATIPENLVESELFGHERGAFSGAHTAKPGLFEAADGGTLLLDELGELPKGLQPKLLRVLETGEVMRIGAVRPLHVNVRIISATNRNILSEIASDRFRSDLYYRLNGITLVVPPLRDRPADIPAVAEHFATESVHGSACFSPDAMAALAAHSWPGNVRELKSVVERALLLSGGGTIERNHIVLDAPVDEPQSHHTPTVSQPPASARHRGKVSHDPTTFAPQERPTSVVAAEYEAELARRETRRIREALARAGGNQKDAAKLLGISRRTLINRIERYGIERPRKRSDEP